MRTQPEPFSETKLENPFAFPVPNYRILMSGGGAVVPVKAAPLSSLIEVVG